jgi:hypothetical protein
MRSKTCESWLHGLVYGVNVHIEYMLQHFYIGTASSPNSLFMNRPMNLTAHRFPHYDDPGTLTSSL